MRPSSCSRSPLRDLEDQRAWSPGERARRRRGARGFTLPELLAVVVLIGILAAAASPSFVNGMRDRRVNRVAMEISGIYRLARHQALGRGTAVHVRWTASTGEFEVRQARIEDVEIGSIIPKSCLSVVNWTDPVETDLVTRINVTGAELSAVSLSDPGGTARNHVDVCFTGRGRTFVRYDPGVALAPLLGALRADVTNTDTGLVRAVFVPPNGVARLGL